LRLSNAEVGRLAALARNPSPTPVLRPMEQKVLLHMMGAEGWRDAVQLAWARSRAPLNDRAWTRLLRLPERWDIPNFPLTGHDLIASGMAPGPELGQVLRRLEDWWVASGFTASKAELLARRNA
jgi:tRNA nucleotidyltransferase/poly(A) polymerase